MLDSVKRIQISLYGSLGATGKGHGSDIAVFLGLLGEDPATVDVNNVDSIVQNIKDSESIRFQNKDNKI